MAGAYPRRIFVYTYHRGGNPFDMGTVVVIARVEARARAAAEQLLDLAAAQTLELEGPDEPLRDPLPDGAQVVYHDRRGGGSL